MYLCTWSVLDRIATAVETIYIPYDPRYRSRTNIWVLVVIWNFFSLGIRLCLEFNLVLKLGFVTLILIAGS